MPTSRVIDGIRMVGRLLPRLLLLAAPAWTQEVASIDSAPRPAADAASMASAPLTLATALARARRTNMAHEIAQARIASVQALLDQAYSLLRPSLNLSGGYSSVSSSDRPWGTPPARSFTGQIAVSLTVFNASAIPAVAAARRNLEAQRRTSAEIERTLGFAVVRSFLQIISSERQLQAAMHRQGVAVHSVADAKARAGAGLASGNDATRARLEQATADLSLTGIRQAVETARLALAQLIGEPAEQPLALPASVLVPTTDLVALDALAIGHRNDLQALHLQAQAERKLALQARLGAVPTVAVVGSYTDRSVSGTNAALFSAGVFPSPQPVWSIGLNAQWSLYDGGVRSAQAAGYDAAARDLEAQYLDLRSLVHRDLATALVALESSRSAVTQAQIQVEVSRINSSEIQARSGEGLATALEVADANASQYEAEAGLAQRTFDLESSGLQIRNLVGLWPDQDDPPGSRTEPPP